MSHAEPLFDVAIRKARHGHRDWLVWKNRQGDTQIAVISAEALKAAMLAVGTQGRFTLVAANSAHFHRMSWGLAVLHWRNAKRGWL